MNTSPYRRGKEFLPEAHDAEPDANIQWPKWADVSAQSLLDAAPDAMLVVNRAGEIVVANLQAERLFGYEREELIGRSVESLIPSRLRAEHSQDRKNFFGDPPVRPTGMGLELLALRKDGTEVPVEISLSTLTSEAGTFVVSAIRDATDRRRTEGLKVLDAVLRETRESEERFSLIADTASALIWMSGSDKLCTHFNKPWLDLTSIAETRATKSRYGVEEATMSCRSCGSENRTEFDAEIMIHFRGLRNLDKPGVLIFPKLAACLDCGFSEFTLEETELPVLKEGVAA
ncbi:MAG: PAS domain-containing protein [Candidatus Angelobacter sp.]